MRSRYRAGIQYLLSERERNLVPRRRKEMLVICFRAERHSTLYDFNAWTFLFLPPSGLSGGSLPPATLGGFAPQPQRNQGSARLKRPQSGKSHLEAGGEVAKTKEIHFLAQTWISFRSTFPMLRRGSSNTSPFQTFCFGSNPMDKFSTC